ASKRLESMINNLLHHSRMEAGLYQFDLTQKDLSTAGQTAIEEVRPLADRKTMTIQYQGVPGIQAAFNWDGKVPGFVNLLLNAIKYGQENTPIEVDAQLERKGPVPNVVVSVLNQGEPIPASELSRLFERFYRGANSGPQKGMGLGLHVVKKIVEAHNGD